MESATTRAGGAGAGGDRTASRGTISRGLAKSGSREPYDADRDDRDPPPRSDRNLRGGPGF